MTSQNTALLSTIQDVKHILSLLLFCILQKSRTLSSTPRTKCVMRGEGCFCAARQQDPPHLTNTIGESYTVLRAHVFCHNFYKSFQNFHAGNCAMKQQSD